MGNSQKGLYKFIIQVIFKTIRMYKSFLHKYFLYSMSLILLWVLEIQESTERQSHAHGAYTSQSKHLPLALH